MARSGPAAGVACPSFLPSSPGGRLLGRAARTRSGPAGSGDARRPHGASGPVRGPVPPDRAARSRSTPDSLVRSADSRTGRRRSAGSRPEGPSSRPGRSWSSSTRPRFAQEYGEKRSAVGPSAKRSRASRGRPRQPAGPRRAWPVTQKTIAVEKAKLAAATPRGVRARQGVPGQPARAVARRRPSSTRREEDLAALRSVLRRDGPPEADRARESAPGARGGGSGRWTAWSSTAPRDGILVVADHPWQGRKIQVGDSVWVGLPVVSLPDLRRDAGRGEALRRRRRADRDGLAGRRCILDAYPDRTYAGRIAEITPVAQEAAGRSLRRAYNVRVKPGRRRTSSGCARGCP